MPIIYTYPSATPATEDLLLISDTSETDPEKATRKCTVGDLVSLVGALVPGGGTVSSVTLDFQTTGLTTGGGASETITTSGTFDVAGTLVAANGGTGHASYAVGDILYASGATALSKLAVGSNTHVLTLSGGIPTWAAPATSGTVTSVDMSGGTTGLTYSGGPVTGSGTITTAGTLVVANGGSGATSFNTSSVIVNGASGTGPLTDSGSLANGKLVIGRTGLSPVAGSIASADASITVTETAGAIDLSANVTGMSQFNLAGSAGVTQVINNADTVTIVGGNNINTIAAATDKVTVDWVAPVKTNYDGTLALRGSGGGTIAAGAFTTNLAAYYEIGDFMYVEYYLVWTSAAGAGITDNLILTTLPKAAYQTGAAIDNGNCLIHANDNLGKATGDATSPAPTTGWVGKSGVATEMTYRYADSSSHIFADYPYANRKTAESPNYTLAGTITYLVNIHD